MYTYIYTCIYAYIYTWNPELDVMAHAFDASTWEIEAGRRALWVKGHSGQ